MLTQSSRVVSQSFFLVRIAKYTADADLPSYITAFGFSGLPMILFVVFDGILLIGMIWLGWRRFRSAIPVAGFCSAAISAACHPPATDIDAAVKPVMWGVVQVAGDDEPGHCSFTSLEVSTPEVGKVYY